MAVVAGMPPILRLRRSAQSGLKAMTAAWQVVYTENTSPSALAYIFGGAEFNLTPMATTDVIEVRIRKILVPTGAWVNHDAKTYRDAPDPASPSRHIGSILDVYGVEISMRQTSVAVALLTLECEFYDAKRLGLA